LGEGNNTGGHEQEQEHRTGTLGHSGGASDDGTAQQGAH
jgi:hypothetical protein